MALTAKIRIDFRPLEKYIKRISEAGQPGFDAVMLKWLVRYKKSLRAAFNRNSSGGGQWPPLKTPIRKRVKTKSKQILRDSDTIRGATEPIPTLDHYPAPGATTIRTKNGLQIGFGGYARHPFSKLTVGKLIAVHNYGLGNVPVRQLLVTPDEELKRGMRRDVIEVAKRYS